MAAGAASSSSSLSSPDLEPNPGGVSIAYAGRSMAAAPPRSGRRPPPPCWTHEETLALIDAYREKWYSLARGNLRADHWEEVADAVSTRCRSLPTATPKTSVQCRHKVEKLRRRLRAEKQRAYSHDPSAPPSSSWAYFSRMDAMERGPGAAPTPHRPDDYEDDGSDEEDDEDIPTHRHMPNGSGGGLRSTVPKSSRSRVVGFERGARPPHPNPSRLSWGYGGVKQEVHEMMDRKRKRDERWEEEEEDDEGGDALGDLASALRMLGDSFLRMEQMKMEMAREREKMRMEMELKRTEVILDCHRSLAESLANGFSRKKKRTSGALDS